MPFVPQAVIQSDQRLDQSQAGNAIKPERLEHRPNIAKQRNAIRAIGVGHGEHDGQLSAHGCEAWAAFQGPGRASGRVIGPPHLPRPTHRHTRAKSNS
jgi:hypothetical protein